MAAAAGTPGLEGAPPEVKPREVKHLCIQCGKHFSKSCNLARHMRIHQAEMQMCSHCGKEFKTSDYLRCHIRKEHSGEERPIVCLICGLIFTVKKDLKRHMKAAHKGQKPPRLPYVCTECGKGFGRPQLLQDHIVTHSGAKPYNCEECGQGFLHQYKYEKHVEIHRAKKQNICPDCGEGFSNHMRLTAHMQTHVVHKCPDCDKEFKTEVSLMLHYNQHATPFECSACGKGFKDEGLLKKHMSIHATCPGAPDVCPDCGRWFSDPDQLKDHMWSHKPDSQYVCDQCQRSFSTPTSLKIHMRSHSGVKTHVCAGCGKGFHTAAYLHTHMLNCSKAAAGEANQAGTAATYDDAESADTNRSIDRPYVCGECGNRFTEAGSLRRHQLIHQEGEKPFSCIHCFLTFRTSGQLKLHLEKQHPGGQYAQYACPVCMKGLPTPDALKVHMIIHEGSHVCPHCGKAYETAEQLTVHLKTHNTSTEGEAIERIPQPMDSDDLPTKDTDVVATTKRTRAPKGSLMCPTCGKVFERQNHLNQHMRRHTAVRQFWCRRCGKGFAEAVVLRRHMMTHGGKKPVQCMECGRRFMDRWHLKVHLKSKTHRLRKDIHCEQCGKGVSSQEALKLHMEAHRRREQGQQGRRKQTNPKKDTNNSEHLDGSLNQSDQPMGSDQSDQPMDEEHVDDVMETGSGAGNDEDEGNSNHSHAEDEVDTFKDELDTFKEVDTFKNEDNDDNIDPESSHTVNAQTQAAPPHAALAFDQLTSEDRMKLASDQVARANRDKTAEVHTCETCGAQFPRLFALRAHMKAERCYVCKECGKRYGEAVILRRHLLIHSGMKPKLCLLCGKRFMDATKLNKHMRTHDRKLHYTMMDAIREQATTPQEDPPQEDPPQEVTVKEEPLDADEYGEEEEYVPPSKSKKKKLRHVCFTCGKEFASTSNLKAHVKTHTKDRARPFVCPICGKAFAEAGVLRRHKLTHGGQKPKQCTLCGKRFMDATHLKSHMRTHTREQPFSCPVCLRGLSTKYSLTNHLKTHTRDTPHVCTDCGKGFSTLEDLNAHVEMHIQSIENEIYGVSDQLKTEQLSPTSQEQTAIKPEYVSDTENAIYDLKLKPEVRGLFENLSHRARSGRVEPTDAETYPNHLSPQVLNVLDDHRRAHAGESDSANSNDVEAFSNYSDHYGTIDGLEDNLTTEKNNFSFDKATPGTSALASGSRRSDGREKSLRVSSPVPSGADRPPSVPGHLSTHTGEKPYSCTQCHKTFTTSTHLMQHTLGHAGTGYNALKGQTKNDSTMETENDGNVPVDPTEAETTQNVFVPQILDLLDSQWKPPAATDRGRGMSSDDDEVASHHSESSVSIDLDDDHPTTGTRDFESPPKPGRASSLDTVEKTVLPGSETGDNMENIPQAVNTDQKKQPVKAGSKLSVKKHQRHPHIKSRVQQKASTGLLTFSDGRGVCPVCSKVFSRKSNLKAHFVTHTKARPWVCDTCGDGFTEAGSLRRHIRTHTGEKPFPCPQCDKTFRTSTHLKRHSLTHTGVKDFQCLQCERAFSTPASLRLHTMIHTGEKPYVCLVCHKGFRLANHLDYHMVSHSVVKMSKKAAPTEPEVKAPEGEDSTVVDTPKTTDKPHMCSECGKCFGTNGILRKHKMIHTGEKPYLCSECGKRFVDATKLKQHAGRHRKVKFYVCSDCGKGFSAAHSMKAHIKRKHPGEGPCVCGCCGKGFRSSALLGDHLTTCEKVKRLPDGTTEPEPEPVEPNDRPHVCFECGRGFGTRGILKKHMMTHTGEKPHECSYCGRKFRTYTHLKRHTMTHTGEKPYGCTECGQRFGGSLALEIHFRLHTGEKPFACVWCGDAYRTIGLLSRHIKTCNGVKQSSTDNDIASALTVMQSVHAGRKWKAVAEGIDEYTYANCYLCVQGFDRIPDLIEHLAVHALAL